MLVLFCGSQLASVQLAKHYQARDPESAQYVQKAQEMDKLFLGFEVRNIQRTKNEEADAIAKAAAGQHPMPEDVLHEVRRTSSVTEGEPSKLMLTAGDWQVPIRAFIEGWYVPDNRVEEQCIQHRARGYLLQDGILYKGRVCAPLLRCLSRDEGKHLLKDIHEGLCASHIAPRALVAKAFLQGFYWPAAARDAEEMVEVCPGCQWTGHQSHLPLMALQPIPLVWPLARWGMDIIGPLPAAPGGYRFVIVAIDYFSKWLEAEPLVKIMT